MTPGARAAAAIALLDAILSGVPAEKALTTWARRSRFAGSGDRAAIRDLVFDGLRRMRSAAARGGAMTGRGILLGLLAEEGTAPGMLFTGEGHAPPPPTAEELAAGRPPAPGAEAADCPDWLWPRIVAVHGSGGVMEAQRDRAPVFLRCAGPRDRAAGALAAEGIGTRIHRTVPTALEVTGNARRVQASRAYAEGLVELQDASSQAAVLALPLLPGMAVLDYCAGGGGKALAMAARMELSVTAHDVDPRRMADIEPRATRAGARIQIATRVRGLFDLVLVDAPCSGSGTWRRTPEAKWRLTADRLDDLVALQGRVLAEAAGHVAPGGWLAYATCSILEEENDGTTGEFLAARPDWSAEEARRWRPGPLGDGFYLRLMQAPARH